MKAIALLAAVGAFVGSSGCTYHAAIGGMGNLQTDGTTASERVPKAHLALLAGAGPCLRWPRLRASLTVDGAIRGASASTLGAAEVMWIFDEGYARNTLDGVVRTSLGLKSRLAGGWNWITDRWIAEAGLGVAIVMDSYHHRDFAFSSGYAGDYHAASLDVLITYAPDRAGEDEAWLGAQLSFEINGIGVPLHGRSKTLKQAYSTPRPGDPTDCNSGHLP
ncbi:MAG: hypothetical protein JNK64_21945 [Myxococcales bacterium]|nr:hypothetical protein [Myxococcales bacterium]